MRSFILLNLTLVIEAIKVFTNSRAFNFCKDQTATMMIEIFVDFLYRLKDRLPYSNSEIKKDMDVFYMIMEFLIPNGYLPSAALLKEYSESKVTKKFNTLPSLEYINAKFGEYRFMSYQDYELLKKRFESRPPFVFYFNPNIEFQEINNDWQLMVGLFDVDDVSINKWNRLKI